MKLDELIPDNCFIEKHALSAHWKKGEVGFMSGKDLKIALRAEIDERIKAALSDENIDIVCRHDWEYSQWSNARHCLKCKKTESAF